MLALINGSDISFRDFYELPWWPIDLCFFMELFMLLISMSPLPELELIVLCFLMLMTGFFFFEDPK